MTGLVPLSQAALMFQIRISEVANILKFNPLTPTVAIWVQI